MATAPTSSLSRFVHRCIAANHAANLSDDQLLKQFREQSDEAAFAALVRRHGPLVLGVCRRLLRDWQAAEDCFQAVFLLLANKADSLRRSGSLGPWLHAVAVRTALKARARAVRRKQQEQQAAVPEAVEPPDQAALTELRSLLDEALSQMPEKYRVPLVLHYLEGLTVPEVARQLGCPEGTAATRLARARQRLRSRLARSGLANPAAMVAALTGLMATDRVVPDCMVSAVAALAQGGVKTMSMTKLTVAAVLAVAVAVLGAGSLSLLPSSGAAPIANAATPPVTAVEPEKQSSDRHLAEFSGRTGHPGAASFSNAKLDEEHQNGSDATAENDQGAEPSPEPPPAASISGPLGSYLRQWEKETRQARSLSAHATRTERNRNLQLTTVFTGTIRLLGLNRDLMEMRRKDQPGDVQKVLRSGTALYEYVSASKEVHKRRLPARQSWLEDANRPIESVFRIRVAEVERSVRLHLAKEDKWYVYIDLRPRPGAFRPSWERARLVLSKENGLPRQLWLKYPGNEVIWDFPQVKLGERMDRKEFEPRVPPGWKMVEHR
jgi:RNA polymerase sigma factor (sigma-70 family)